jgi:hypothetical protein
MSETLIESNIGRQMFIVRLFIVSLSAVLVLSPIAVQAKEKVATALINGEIVELYSDRTWGYADKMEDTDAGCVAVQSGVAFCGASLGWKQMPNNDPEIDALYRLNPKTFGMLLVEEIGTADGVGLKTMRGNVISNFAAGAEIMEEAVTVFGVEASSVSGVSGETVVYGGDFKGLNVVFSNTIVIQEKRTVQVVTYVLGSAPTEKSNALHQEFLSRSKLN